MMMKKAGTPVFGTNTKRQHPYRRIFKQKTEDEEEGKENQIDSYLQNELDRKDNQIDNYLQNELDRQNVEYFLNGTGY